MKFKTIKGTVYTASDRKKAVSRLLVAKSNLIIRSPFFGFLFSKQILVDGSSWLDTAGVDGKHFYYNYDFINSLSGFQLQFLICHELLHLIYKHGSIFSITYPSGLLRNKSLLNVANDYVVNRDSAICIGRKSQEYELPKGVFINPEYESLSSYAIYEILLNDIFDKIKENRKKNELIENAKVELKSIKKSEEKESSQNKSSNKNKEKTNINDFDNSFDNFNTFDDDLFSDFFDDNNTNNDNNDTNNDNNDTNDNIDDDIDDDIEKDKNDLIDEDELNEKSEDNQFDDRQLNPEDKFNDFNISEHNFDSLTNDLDGIENDEESELSTLEYNGYKYKKEEFDDAFSDLFGDHKFDAHLDFDKNPKESQIEKDEDGNYSISSKPFFSSKEKEKLKFKIKNDLLIAKETFQNQLVSGAGVYPSGLIKALDELSKPVLSWKKFVRHSIYSLRNKKINWTSPHRRSFDSDFLRPSYKKQKEYNIHISIDASGSINTKMVTDFLSEIIGGCKQLGKVNVNIWSFDSAIYNHKVYDSRKINKLKEYTVYGGGGTEFLINWKFMQDNKIKPDLFIMFTDGIYADAPGIIGYCETLYIIPEKYKEWVNIDKKYGKTIFYNK